MFYTVAPLRFAVQSNVLGLTNGREQRGTFEKGRVHVSVETDSLYICWKCHRRGKLFALREARPIGAFCFESRVHFNKQ